MHFNIREYNSNSERQFFSFFPNQNPTEKILPRQKNKSRSTQGNLSYKLTSTRVPDATYEMYRQFALWFLRRKIYKVLPCMDMVAMFAM